MQLPARFVPMTILMAAFSVASALAQSTSPAPCTLHKQVYTCDKASFAAALKQSKTIAIETQPRDHAAPAQLKELVVSLGKSLAPDTGDLIFRITRTESTGIYVGPAGTPLATLSIYTQAPDGSRGSLVWLETFIGQPDMRWPSVVHATVQQFQEDFK